MQSHTLIEGMIEAYLVMHNHLSMCSACNDYYVNNTDVIEAQCYLHQGIMTSGALMHL